MGFGTSPFAGTPFGPGSPATATAPPEDVPTGAKFLNYRTGDYERNADGSYKRMPVTRQRVMIRLGSLRGSSTVLRELGTLFPDRIGPDYERRCRIEVEQALADMIAAGEIALDFVRLESTSPPGRVGLVVAYTTADGEPDQLSI